MTYQVKETSTQSVVYELYEFYTTTRNWYYTTFDQPVEADLFQPLPIKRKQITRTDNLLRQELQIEVPGDSIFALEAFASLPEEILGVNLFAQHYEDPDKVLLFKGRLIRNEVKENTLILAFEPMTTTLRRPGLHQKYHRLCRHPLYGHFCGVTSQDHTATGAVLSNAGDTITLAEAENFDDSYFTAGYIVSANGLRRMVVNHTGQELKLIRPMESLQDGETITVYAGCDHTRSTCLTKFDNVDNYGGFDEIPRDNPFNGLTVF